MTDKRCPRCNATREDLTKPCASCGAPAVSEHRAVKKVDETVRPDDLEPYVALSYIARLFKVLAVLMIIMLIGEVIIGIMTDGRAAIVNLIGEATRLLVLAGLLWAAGDLAILLIDVGHDMRVSRILLGRIAKHQDDAATKSVDPTGAEEAERRRVG